MKILIFTFILLLPCISVMVRGSSVESALRQQNSLDDQQQQQQPQLYPVDPLQFVDDSPGGDVGLKRAMGMLRMGRGASAQDDDQLIKRAMGMLRMGRAAPASAAAAGDKRAMGMLRMGRSGASEHDLDSN